MKKILLSIIQTASTFLATAQPVSVINGSVKFTPPEGFIELSAEQMSAKYPRANQPQAVYATPDMSVSVAFTLSPAKVAPEQLAELKEAMEKSLPKMVPDLSWITREIVVNNDVRWVHLELTSSAVDTDIHNNMYMTSLKGRMLGLNFNATTSAYAEYAAALQRSFQSVQLQRFEGEVRQPTK